MKSGTRIVDGSVDFSYGIDSSVSPTIRTQENPNGLPRNALSWLVNGDVRTNGILTRTGWQPLCTVDSGTGLYQGGWMYEPDFANPYLVLCVGGRVLQIRVDTDNSVNDITGSASLPPTYPLYHFAQGEQFLVIRPADGITLPVFWDGSNTSTSIGINNRAVAPGSPGVNEIPAGNGPLIYYMQRLWYADGRRFSAGDIVRGNSGTAPYNYRDSILNVTENPLVLSLQGDGFTVPTNAGNIRAFAYPIQLDEVLGQGPLFVFTPKQIYAQTVPVTRTDWIGANDSNQPIQRVVMNTNGAVGDRCIVAVNGDLFYQSRDPAIRSFTMAVRYFQQWGNRPISNNIIRALQFNDRSLMRTASGIEFDNRVWQTILPKVGSRGTVFQGIAALDLDPISTLKQDKLPAWQGMYEGVDFLQLFEGDFGGLQRAFAVVESRLDHSIQVWELTTASRTEDGDKRTTMLIEFPAFDGSSMGSSLFEMKELDGCTIWADKMAGTIDFTLTYRVDQNPCEFPWATWQKCFARDSCEDTTQNVCYPLTTLREGYGIPMGMPKPKAQCQQGVKRPSTLGFSFQPVLRVKGWCRIRGIEIYMITRDLASYQDLIC